MIQRQITKVPQEKKSHNSLCDDLVLEPQEHDDLVLEPQKHDPQSQLTFRNWWQTDFRSAGTLPLKELLHMVRFGFSFGFSFQFRVEVWGFLVWGLGFSLVSLHTHPRALADGPRLCPPTPSLFSLAISLSSLSLSLSLSLYSLHPTPKTPTLYTPHPTKNTQNLFPGYRCTWPYVYI
jgi:hypothetical protein